MSRGGPHRLPGLRSYPFHMLFSSCWSACCFTGERQQAGHIPAVDGPLLGHPWPGPAPAPSPGTPSRSATQVHPLALLHRRLPGHCSAPPSSGLAPHRLPPPAPSGNFCVPRSTRLDPTSTVNYHSISLPPSAEKLVCKKRLFFMFLTPLPSCVLKPLLPAFLPPGSNGAGPAKVPADPHTDVTGQPSAFMA